MGPIIMVVGPSDDIEKNSELYNFIEFLYKQEESNAVVGIVRVCLIGGEEFFLPTIETTSMPPEARMPLRGGCLDLPLLNFLVHGAGITKLALARMDLLGENADIKMCVDYKEMISTERVAEADPIFKHFKGPWNLENCSSRENLPDEVKRYLRIIEDPIGLPISCISNGRGPGHIICV